MMFECQVSTPISVVSAASGISLFLFAGASGEARWEEVLSQGASNGGAEGQGGQRVGIERPARGRWGG